MTTTAPWTAGYQPGVPAEIELPTEPLPALLDAAVAADPDAVALDFFGATTSYGELGASVSRVATALKRLGVEPGDRVALVLPNCPQHVIAFYAALRIGAVVVEHNPLYTARELAEMFADHGARVAVVWDAAAAKLPAGLDHVVAVDLTQAMPAAKRLALRLPVRKLRETRAKLHADAPGTLPWAGLLKHEPIAESWPRPGVHDLAVIQYTSGTTGRFKGAMLTHFNLFANARQGAAWMKDAIDGAEVCYALLPMFHAFGMTLYLTHAILRRARLVLFPSFDVDLVLDAAKKHPPTIYCAVPPIYRRTAERAKERGVSLASAKFCISGAMALTDDVVELWESVSGGLLVEGYGLTECSPVALGNPFWPTRKTGTIGVPFPSTRMTVVDPDDPDREVEPGTPGELLVSGPQVFGGYWNAPDETAAALHDGWLRTGDLVVVDDEGYATVVDRLKEIIVTGGFNVSPSEVEGVLREHPAIADVAVIGLVEGGGEHVVAAVVLEAGASLDAAEARTWAKERLASYKVPRRFVEVPELPKSMLGKVLRKQVRDQLAASGAAS